MSRSESETFQGAGTSALVAHLAFEAYIFLPTFFFAFYISAETKDRAEGERA